MPTEMIVDNHDNKFLQEISDQDWIYEKPISVLSLDPADRKVLKVADQRDAIQKKTFTKWINFYLSTRNGLYVDDLFLDLRDGHLLLTLLEIFTNQIIPRERGTSKFHALRNIEQCLQCLKHDHNIRLVNIRPEELVNGNPKLTLGLIWRIILHFQFSDITSFISDDNISINSHQSIPSNLPIQSTLVSNSITIETSVKKILIDQVPSNYRHRLLLWARQQCQHYPGIYVEDFTNSWRNGRAFLAILHRHNPKLIDIQQAYRSSNRENLTRAFNFAEKHYRITKLIDPEDVDSDVPDEKCILLYISHLYKVCSNLPIHPFQEEHNRIQQEGKLSYEYTSLSTDLLKWLRIKFDFLNCEIKFQTLEQYQMFKNRLEIIKNTELLKYNQSLQRLRSIDAEFEILQSNGSLQPDIESLNLAWNKLEITINDMENILKKYDKLKLDLDIIEHDITNIEIKSKQTDDYLTKNSISELQIKLDQISNHCQTLSLPNEQTRIVLERINQLNLRININSVSSPTITNGFHHISKEQALSPKIEQLNVIVTEDFRQTRNSLQLMIDDSIQFNIKDLIKELHMIDSILHTLNQLIQQRQIHLSET
ncbi:unnamed protein product, partial [Adineta steineri]